MFGQRPKGVSRGLDETFRISVALKGLDGLLETIGGLLLLLITPATMTALARSLTQHELSEDPHDFVAQHVLHSAQHFSHGHSVFAAVFLLSHGVAKLVVVLALLQGRTWAYPGMIGLLGAFIVYQVYRVLDRFSLGLTLLSAFDAFVIWLSWRGWRAARDRGS